MDLKQLIKKAHSNAKNKGFWDKKREIGTLLMLIVSELGEALESDRKNKFADTSLLDELLKNGCNNIDSPLSFTDYFENGVKDTFQDEIADTFIRLFDLCGGLNIDIEKFIDLKMKYNETRDRLHGKKY